MIEPKKPTGSDAEAAWFGWAHDELLRMRPIAVSGSHMGRTARGNYLITKSVKEILISDMHVRTMIGAAEVAGFVTVSRADLNGNDSGTTPFDRRWLQRPTVDFTVTADQVFSDYATPPVFYNAGAMPFYSWRVVSSLVGGNPLTLGPGHIALSTATALDAVYGFWNVQTDVSDINGHSHWHGFNVANPFSHSSPGVQMAPPAGAYPFDGWTINFDNSFPGITTGSLYSQQPPNPTSPLGVYTLISGSGPATITATRGVVEPDYISYPVT